jgi:hypothetical protein
MMCSGKSGPQGHSSSDQRISNHKIQYLSGYRLTVYPFIDPFNSFRLTVALFYPIYEADRVEIPLMIQFPNRQFNGSSFIIDP